MGFLLSRLEFYLGTFCFFLKPLEISSAHVEAMDYDTSPRENIKKLFSVFSFGHTFLFVCFVLFVFSFRASAVILIIKDL